ncbi:MAG TPA: peptide ABC transporter substrate-binding protein [Chloroflexota bacterium]|nr:peptide ABC transporter substrate-binding protein [Chloroflexota bacterium]
MVRSLVLFTVCLILISGCSPATSRPRDPGTLHWGLAGVVDIPTLDPALASDPVSINVCSLIYGGLVRLDQHLHAVPDGATRWTISHRGTIYTFHLRHDLRYANGRRVHAADIAASLQRALGPDGAAGPAAVYLADIAAHGVTAPNDATVRIVLTHPAAQFLTELAFPTAFVPEPDLPARYGSAWTSHAAGFGPFAVQSWQHGRSLRLVRNRYYYGGLPKVRRIVLQMYGSDAAGVRAYRSGAVDVLSGLPPAQALPHVSGARAMPALAMDYLAFNTTRLPFRRLDVRHAFAAAAGDPLAVMQGTAFPAAGFLPSAFGINVPLWTPHRSAADYLARAHYPRGRGFPEVALVLPRDPHLIALAHRLTARWRQELGVVVAIRPLNPTNYTTVLDSRQFDVALVRWGGDYPDPQDFLGTQIGPSSDNVTGWTGPIYARLLAEASRLPPAGASRAALFRTAASLAETHLPIYPLDEPAVTAAIRPGWSGLSLTGLGTISGEWSHVQDTTP